MQNWYQISKNHSPSGEYSINRDIVTVKRSSQLLKRIVTIVVRNGLVDDTTRNILVKMLITYLTESQAHYLYGGVPTLN